MSEQQYYFWDPIGIDPSDNGKPLFRQLKERDHLADDMARYDLFSMGLKGCTERLAHYCVGHPEDEKAMDSLVMILSMRRTYFGDWPKRNWVKGEVLRRYPHPFFKFSEREVIAGVFALALNGQKRKLDLLNFPLFLNGLRWMSPRTWAWVRFVKTGKEKYARAFHFLLLNRITYLNRLKAWQGERMFYLAMQLFLCPNPDLSAILMKTMDPNNLFFQLLTDHDQRIILLCKPDKYKGRKGWQPWLSECLWPIPEEEEVQVDKDFLIRIATIWKEKKLKENPINLIKGMFGDVYGKSTRN